MSAAADPALARVWAAALAARERRGFFGDGWFTVAGLTVAEADALDALPWTGRRSRILSGTDFKARLSRFEAAVADTGLDPLEGYERHAGRTPRDLPAERAGRRDHASAEHFAELRRDRPVRADQTGRFSNNAFQRFVVGFDQHQRLRKRERLAQRVKDLRKRIHRRIDGEQGLQGVQQML